MTVWRFYAAVVGIAAFAGAILALVLSPGLRGPAAAPTSAAPTITLAFASPSASITPAPTVSPSPTATPAPTRRTDVAGLIHPAAPTRVIAGTNLVVPRSDGVDGTTLMLVPVTTTPVSSPSTGASPQTGAPVTLVSFGRSGGWQLRADGRVLAISLDTSPDSARIATWDLRTGAIAWVTPDEAGVRHATPVWSSDPAFLYYASSRGTTDLGIFRIRADGTSRSLVRPPDSKAAGVLLNGLTPDGTGLDFSYVRAGGSANVFDLLSGSDRAFDDNTAAGIVAWRSARPRALVTVGGGAGQPPGTLALWDDIAQTKRVLLDRAVAGSPSGVYSADWDPGGTRIAVAAFTRTGAADSSVLLTMDSTAGARQTVAGSDGAQGALWFRAGIVYPRHTASGGTEVMLINPAGGTPVTLFTALGQLGGRITFVSP